MLTSTNLAQQGFCLTAAERRALRVGLRFSTGLCLGLVAAAVASRSAPAVAILAGIGGLAGWTSRHPFDVLYNRGVARVLRTPILPRTPVRRRHAFKVAATWLAAIAAALWLGQEPVAISLGGALIALCAVQTVTFFCAPSAVLAWWDRRRRPPAARPAGKVPGRSAGEAA